MGAILRAGSIVLVLGAASGAFAQTPIELTVVGDTAQGTISLPGDVNADLTITFENPVGLSPTALEVSAELVDPEDPDLLGRLPAGTSLQGAFPVLVRIGPATPSGLRFKSLARVSLYTHNLVYNPAAPQALVKAHDGGSFADITTAEGIGSYRVSGSSGDFSEFLIVRDARGEEMAFGGYESFKAGGSYPALLDGIDGVIIGKFDALQATLNAYGSTMPLLVATQLQLQLTAARTLYVAGSLLAAINKLTSFLSYIVLHTGADIPGVWVASNPALINVAGLLRAGAETLQFSIDRAASQ